MKITPEFLRCLYEKAVKATSGKWEVQSPLEIANDEHTFLVKCVHRWGKVDQASNDIEYIAAANPATMVALIQEIYRLENALNELVGKCRELDPDFEIERWREWWKGWTSFR